MKLPEPKYEVTRIDEDNKHLYRVASSSGKVLGTFPGITGRMAMLGGAKGRILMQWAAKLTDAYWQNNYQVYIDNPSLADEFSKTAKSAHKRAFEEAGEWGTEVHDIIEDILNGVPAIEVPSRSIVPIVGWNKYWRSEPRTLISAELRVASLSDGYGGTLDVLYKDKDGRLVLEDWKTSKSIDKPEYAAQLSALNRALFEQYRLSAEVLRCTRIDKETGHVQVKEVTDPARAMRVFKHLLELEGELKERLLA